MRYAGKFITLPYSSNEMNADSCWSSITIRFLFACCLLPPTAGAKAQGCLPKGITFSSQVQIDAFPSDYPGCTTILGDVIVREAGPDPITNLDGLAQIESFGQALEITDNHVLINLSGLEAVTAIGGRLSIRANRSLTSLEGLKNLSSLGESLSISSNKSLSSIAALSGLTAINGDLSISGNDNLHTLAGLQSTDSVHGNISISFNNSLTDLDGLISVRWVGRVLHIHNNMGLRYLTGLDSIHRVGADVIIESNPALLSLTGLNSVAHIGGYLQIANNAVLTNLRGLDGIRSMQGLLQIYNNPSLTSLAGIDSIDHENIADLAIISCEKLTACSVKSICNYLSVADNTASIRDNEERCNSRTVILSNCTRTDGGDLPVFIRTVLYPNPTAGPIQIEGPGLDSATFRITDSVGRLVLRGKVENNTLDLSHLAVGLYFIQLTTDKRNILQPVCKIE